MDSVIDLVKPQQLLRTLAHNQVFADLDDRALNHMLDVSTLCTFEQGDLIIRQGDEANGFYVVVDGTAKLLQVTPDGHQVLVRYIIGGQEFGLIAALAGFAYPLTIEAVTACTLLCWSSQVLADSFERIPRLGLNALRIMVIRNQETQRRYQELLTERVEQRVAQALLRLGAQVGVSQENGLLIDIPLTREDLADFTGTTLFSVSRILRRWQLDGFLEAGRGRVLIRDMDAIHAIADTDGQEAGPCFIPCSH